MAKKKKKPAWRKAWDAGEVTPKTPQKLKRYHARKVAEMHQQAGMQSPRPKKGPAPMGGGEYPLEKHYPVKLSAATRPMWEEEGSPIGWSPEERGPAQPNWWEKLTPVRPAAAKRKKRRPKRVKVGIA